MPDLPATPQPPATQTETDLRKITSARVALGRTGNALPTQHQLSFQLDHASARDAVQMQLNTALLLDGLRERGWPSVSLSSAACVAGRIATHAPTRRTYLQRPDLGRSLSPESIAQLRETAAGLPAPPEVSFVIADGLSALAIERHALPLLDALHTATGETSWHPELLCVVQNGRVAIGDQIGEILRATLSLVLIGERPGLSAPDSMGLYLTWAPQVGRTDADRICISNIRGGGLSYADAAERLLHGIHTARQQRRTGVELSGSAHLPLLA